MKLAPPESDVGWNVILMVAVVATMLVAAVCLALDARQRYTTFRSAQLQAQAAAASGSSRKRNTWSRLVGRSVRGKPSRQGKPQHGQPQAETVRRPSVLAITANPMLATCERKSFAVTAARPVAGGKRSAKRASMQVGRLPPVVGATSRASYAQRTPAGVSSHRRPSVAASEEDDLVFPSLRDGDEGVKHNPAKLLRPITASLRSKRPSVLGRGRRGRRGRRSRARSQWS